MFYGEECQDKSDQLIDASHDYQDNENYVYDDNGNRINDGYVTGENNQLLSDGTYNYEYDNEGNRVRRTEIATGEVTEYEWDYRNRLVAVETEDSEGNVISNSDYTYDVFDRRIAKSVDADGDGVGEAVVERYVHDGNHIALTFDGDGNLTERFLHGLQIDQVLAQENAGGEVLWALADHQGSVRMVLDNEGNVVNNITYDAFGNITIESNPDVNFRFSYTGRELDEETGLYNYRSRYYDPAVGQFINEDTIGFAGGDSNLYRYVANSPLNYTDPEGHQAAGTQTRNNTRYRHSGRSQPKPYKGPRGTGQSSSSYNSGSFGNSPTKAMPEVNYRDLYILNDSEIRRKYKYLQEFGDFFGSDNPELWRVDPEQLPKPYRQPTCITTPGSTCTPPDEENDPLNPNSDWFEKMKELIEEQNRENQERNDDDGDSGDSCGWGDKDKYVKPEANSQKNDDDGQSGSNGDDQPDGGDSFPNQMPEELDRELAIAEELGVKPFKVGSREFEEAVQTGEKLKWGVTLDGDLVFIPSAVTGTEVNHSVLDKGENLQAVGEASIAGGDGQYFVLDINNHSGHYQPNAESLNVGVSAFEKNGLIVPPSSVNPL